MQPSLVIFVDELFKVTPVQQHLKQAKKQTNTHTNKNKERKKVI